MIIVYCKSNLGTVKDEAKKKSNLKHPKNEQI